MSRFYVTLPSNSSMDYYPNNTVARFTTKPNSLIELEGDWEVGLTEISFPSFVENVMEGHSYYNIYVNGQILCKITLEPKTLSESSRRREGSERAAADRNFVTRS